MAKNTREKRDVDVALGGKILVTDAGGQAKDGSMPYTTCHFKFYRPQN